MTDEQQRLNLRIIRESFAAAMASEPRLVRTHIRSVRRFLSDARAEATEPAIIAAIDAFRAEIDERARGLTDALGADEDSTG